MISITILGPVQVTVNGEPAPAELLWRKHLALLVYLARSPRRTATREHLIGLLWADKPESAARHSLNEALRVLRRCGGEDLLTTTVDQITLSPAGVVLDVDEFEVAMAAKQFAAATELMAGEFMAGFAVPGATGFEDWLAAERRRWRERGVAALAQQSRVLADAGRLIESAECATRALDLDPTAEQAVVAVIRALVLSGEPAQALERADAYQQGLEERLGLGPSQQVAALANRVRSGWRRPPPRVEHATVRRAPLVGRDLALGTLGGFWDQARNGEAAAALVVGDPGTGKSRLLEELAARARLDGATVLVVRGVAGDGVQPWAGVMAAARAALAEASGISAIPPEVLGAFVARSPEWRERFPAVSTDQSADLALAFTELLRVISDDQPVMVWLDDAHHLDALSLGVLARLPRELPRARLLVAVTALAAPGCDALDDLRAGAGRSIPGGTVTLGPLDESALRALVAWALPDYDEEASGRVTRRLVRDTAGLPLLAVDVLHAVVSGLDLHDLSGAWPEPLRTLDQSLPGDLPDTIVASLRVSYRRLSPEAQSLLAAASVLGERFGVETLMAATALSEVTVTGGLDELEWSRWLTSEPRGYSFVARVTREVIARDMLTPGQRRRILARATR
jgi:DNA-binding SARP family transcriptional activator